MKIGIIDTGIGNIKSVQRMIEFLGEKVVNINKPEDFKFAKKIIFPGVGKFDEQMNSLKLLKIIDPLKESICIKKIPYLGICLGMQLLCKKSEEGKLDGLNVIDATVYKLKFNHITKIPHMGWNNVEVIKNSPIINYDEFMPKFYFAHSYIVIPDQKELIIGKTEYGEKFCSMIQSENIFGVQFHPEKSHNFGLKLIKKFINI
jgi:glutamine amidotransferase